MKITLDNFKQFISGNLDYNSIGKKHSGVWLHEENMDVSGGKIKISDIDKLKQYPDVDTVTISGLNQETFEYFIKQYGNQLRAIRFHKNKLVKDWSLLGTLPKLEFVYYFFNQRITSLWDMSGNISLRGICISDFCRLKCLEGIEKAPNLEWFEIGDAVNYTSVVDSFRYFSGTKIKYLSFYGKKIEDTDVSFIKDMPFLETFDFPSNLYSTEQVAWIVANYPNVDGIHMKPMREVMKYKDKTNKCDIPAVIVVGKRKPYLTVKGNEKKIKRYMDEFENLIHKYKGKLYSEVFINN